MPGPQYYTSPSGTAYNLYVEMSKQPHLLIAGATGSGKSVAENGLISTLLYRHPGTGPGRVQLLLIDPKKVELSRYRRLPHCLGYADRPDQFPLALQGALDITLRRFELMQRQGVTKYPGGDLWVIIDEFADLMTTNRRQCAPLVQRLAQIGRAARVHVCICTQTPIAKILPTEIRCNFDSRLGLRARSRQDSRNIIDRTAPDLSSLPRYGSGYWMTPEGEELVQVPMVPDHEIRRLVDWWIRQG